jgi:hypothetical protein
LSARLTPTSVVSVFVVLGCAYVFAFPPEVEQEVRADLAIKRFLGETKPWWTCEYTTRRLRREATFVVYRVTLPAEQKCSRSHYEERFEALYDPKRDKIVEVRYPDVPI